MLIVAIRIMNVVVVAVAIRMIVKFAKMATASQNASRTNVKPAMVMAIV
jgi:hypothetical protein